MNDPEDYGLPEPEDELEENEICGEIVRCKHCTQPKYFTNILLYQTHMAEEHPTIPIQETMPKPKVVRGSKTLTPPPIVEETLIIPQTSLDLTLTESIQQIEDLISETRLHMNDSLNRRRSYSDPIHYHVGEDASLTFPSSLDLGLID